MEGVSIRLPDRMTSRRVSQVPASRLATSWSESNSFFRCRTSKLVGRPQALELLPEIFDLPGLFRQPLLISVHDHQPLLISVHDHLAITVENAEVEHVIHLLSA